MMRTWTLTVAFCMIFGAGLVAGETWKNIQANDEKELAGDAIQFLQQDPTGRIWVGTLTGLSYYENGSFHLLKTNDDKPLKAATWCLLKTGPEQYWIGTVGGALFWDGGQVKQTLAGNTVAPIVSYDKDTLWAISKNTNSEINTLVENNGGGWSSVEFFTKRKVVDLYPTSDGKIWVTLDGNGLYAVAPQEKGEPVHHLKGLNVQSIFEDSQKRLWCGRWGGGVVVFDGGKWTEHVKDEKSAVLHIAEAKDGTIWIGTSANGIWRYDGKTWSNDLKADGPISLLQTTSDGRVWVSSQETRGLKYWDGKAWTVSLDNPMPIRCLLETKQKSLWAGGVLDGLHILTP